MIHLNDALAQMEEGKTFDLSFVTADRRKKEAGEIIEMKRCTKIGQRHNMKENQTIGIRCVDNSHHPVAVHIRLILAFNNNKVFY